MCEYCEGKHPVHLYDDGFETVEVFIVYRRLYVDVRCDDYTYNVNTSAPINFCPMCGRELEDVAHRLADLIEPSCDRDTPQKVAEKMFGKMRHSTKEEADAYDAMLKSKSVELHPVDRDALLALADKLEGEGLDGWASGPVNVGDYARRIREACGEEGA